MIGYIETKIVGKLPEVAAHENISRFIFQKAHFAEKSGVVKYGAFMPPPSSFEVSVYRTTGISKNKKWMLCVLFVEPYTGRKPKACADVNAAVVLGNTLTFKADGKPQRRHANIVGWGDEKSGRMMLAKIIAARAVLDIK